MKPNLIKLGVAAAIFCGCSKSKQLASVPANQPAAVAQAAAPASAIQDNPPPSIAPAPAEASADALPRHEAIQGAFGWKLGEKIPSWARLKKIAGFRFYGYLTTTNAPFTSISLNCKKDRTIFIISATTTESDHIEKAQDDMDAIQKTLFSKYGSPTLDEPKTDKWMNADATRLLTAVLNAPRFAGDTQAWSVTVSYIDTTGMQENQLEVTRDDQDAVHPVGNGL